MLETKKHPQQFLDNQSTITRFFYKDKKRRQTFGHLWFQIRIGNRFGKINRKKRPNNPRRIKKKRKKDIKQKLESKGSLTEAMAIGDEIGRREAEEIGAEARFGVERVELENACDLPCSPPPPPFKGMREYMP